MARAVLTVNIQYWSYLHSTSGWQLQKSLQLALCMAHANYSELLKSNTTGASLIMRRLTLIDSVTRPSLPFHAPGI